MAKTHNLGLPRRVGHRELKFARVSYWEGQLPRGARGCPAAGTGEGALHQIPRKS